VVRSEFCSFQNSVENTDNRDPLPLGKIKRILRDDRSDARRHGNQDEGGHKAANQTRQDDGRQIPDWKRNL